MFRNIQNRLVNANPFLSSIAYTVSFNIHKKTISFIDRIHHLSGTAAAAAVTTDAASVAMVSATGGVGDGASLAGNSRRRRSRLCW
jgi:hypothetical protein